MLYASLKFKIIHRLFSLGLRSSESSTWAAALQSDHILCRILWIAENSLNLQLLEKVSNSMFVVFAYENVIDFLI